MAKSVVGVDIGNEMLRAAEVLESGKGRPTLLRYHEVQLPYGVISRGEITEPNTVVTALKQLWSRAGFTSKRVVIGVGNQRVLARDLSVPKMSLQRIRESLPYQVQELLPVAVDDALLDFYPISESVGETGPVVNGLLIAAVKESVLGNVRAVQHAGLTPLNVDLIPFALCRALLGTRSSTGTVALVDVGATGTTVVIATDGVPQFVRIVPAGGADVTAAIAQRLEVPLDAADILKLRLGLATTVSSVEEQNAARVIYDLINELLDSVRNTIDYFTHVRPDAAVQRIVVTGGGARLSGFVPALATATRLDITIGTPAAVVEIGKRVDHELLHSGSASVALGLALGRAA
jgi:type IV pilus assembly protein PilM